MKVRSWHLLHAVTYAVLFVIAVGLHLTNARWIDQTGRIVATVLEFAFAIAALIHYNKYRQIPEGDDTIMGHELAHRFTGPQSRKWVLVALVASLALLAFEAWSILEKGRYHIAALLLTPIILLLAVGGLYDPRIMVGMRKDMPEVTPEIRRISYILAGIGLAIGLFLLYWVGFGPR